MPAGCSHDAVADPMSPDSLFQVAGSIALLGWIALALGPLAPRTLGRVGGVVIPLVLSGGYAAIVLSKANESRPRQERRASADDDMSDVPF
jgi:hypothetical protein